MSNGKSKIEVSIKHCEYPNLESATLYIQIDAPIQMVRECKSMMGNALDMITQASILRDPIKIQAEDGDKNNVN